jgi:hypothetical protein
MEALIPFSLLRNGIVGLIASIVSDTSVNAIRVVKTMKQSLTSKQAAAGGGSVAGYVEIVAMVFTTDGIAGFFRGLQTRIYTNALQSIVFTVIWRGLADRWQKKEDI